MHYQWQFRPYRRSFRQPVITHHGDWVVREGIILRFVNDAGQVGWGEIAPIHWFGSETIEQALAFCHQLPAALTDDLIFSVPDALPACQFAFESAWQGMRDVAIDQGEPQRRRDAENQASFATENSIFQAQNSNTGALNSELRPRNSDVAVQHSVIPVQHSDTQAQNSVIPVQHSVIPVQNLVIPVQHSDTQAQNSVIPVQHSVIPVQNLVIPVQHSDTQAQNPVIPVQNLVIPVQNLVIPVQNLVIPVQHSDTQAQNSDTQAQSLTRPVQDSVVRALNSIAGALNSTLRPQNSKPEVYPTPHSLLPTPHSHFPPHSALLPAGNAALHAWKPRWEKGFRTFKWKIGVGTIATELKLFHALAQTLPNTAKLRLDANGGLSTDEATQWLQACDALIGHLTPSVKVEYIEQPLPPSQFQAMQNLSQRYRTPIALDESIATLQQLQTCYENGWQGIFVVKPAIIGSPTRLRQFCQEHPIDAVFSSAFETAIGRQAGLRLAAMLGNPDRALGYGTTHWFDDAELSDFEQLWQTL